MAQNGSALEMLKGVITLSTSHLTKSFSCHSEKVNPNTIFVQSNVKKAINRVESPFLLTHRL
jgi:hypothetical protein